MPMPMPLPTDAARVRALAADLSEFTIAAVSDVLPARALAALDREDPIPAGLALAGDRQPAALLVRLFMLGHHLDEAELQAALPTSAADAFAFGLIDRTGEGTRALVDLRPTRIGDEDVLLCADLTEAATGQGLRPDHVLGLGGASATLAQLTIRRPARRALDLGAGSGIQALGLRGCAREIIATDLSARAVNFCRFNVALNAALSSALNPSLSDAPTGAEATAAHADSRIEVRTGSLLDPVAGEEFDLIVSNPPFVISPRGGALPQYTYRDGGGSGDDLLAGLIADIPAFLAPSGVAQLLGNWEVHAGQEWQEVIGAWVRQTGLDAWVIQRELIDPEQYVQTWLRDGGLTPERDWQTWQVASREWLADLDSRGVTGIGFGYIVLRRPRRQRKPWVRIEDITGSIAPSLGEPVVAVLDAVEELAETGDGDLAHWRVRVAADVTEERHYRPGAGDPEVIVLRQGGGFARTVRADTVLAAVVGACDGELTLGQIAGAVAALLEVEPGQVWAQVVPDLRGLLTDGLLHRAEALP